MSSNDEVRPRSGRQPEPRSAPQPEPPSGVQPDSRSAPPVDPRFDPAFQRGYRRSQAPASATDASAMDASARKPPPKAGDRSADGRAAPRAFGRARDETEADVRSSTTGVADSSGEFDPDDARNDAEVPHFEGRAPRTNPYLTALWIIGVGFVITGIGTQLWAQMQAGNVSYDPTGGVPLNAVLLNLAYSVGGPMITTGLATIVGLLFLLAVGYRGGRRRP